MKLQFLFVLFLAAPALLRLFSSGTAHPTPTTEPPPAAHQNAPAEPAKSSQPTTPKRADESSSSSSRPADADRPNHR
jgi:hypothetical protein